MATKNLIVHTLWIIQMYEIPRAKPPIQNCLGYLFRERVGIMNLSPECLIYWASGFFLSGVDTEIDTESHGELFFCTHSNKEKC